MIASAFLQRARIRLPGSVLTSRRPTRALPILRAGLRLHRRPSFHPSRRFLLPPVSLDLVAAAVAEASAATASAAAIARRWLICSHVVAFFTRLPMPLIRARSRREVASHVVPLG